MRHVQERAARDDGRHPIGHSGKMSSDNPIPAFVDQALSEWDFIAFFAYDGFESSGRGVVVLFENEQGTQAMYGDRSYFDRTGDTRVIQMLEDYDPEQEFLLHFDAPGGTRTIRIRTPEGGRHPHRVWFFERLRRKSGEA